MSFCVIGLVFTTEAFVGLGDGGKLIIWFFL